MFCLKRKYRNVSLHNAIIDSESQENVTVKGHLVLGDKHKQGYNRSTILRIGKNARLSVEGSFRFYFGWDVQIFDNGFLELNSGFCNSDTKIRCKNRIVIGKDVAIAHDVLIMDCDGHDVNGEKDTGKPIIIGNHVWIGSKSIILKGVELGNNVVVAAGSVVTKSFPANVVIAGNPAKIIRENYEWR